MALVRCPECGRSISDMAEYCINCGFPMSKLVTNVNYNQGFLEIDGTTLITYHDDSPDNVDYWLEADMMMEAGIKVPDGFYNRQIEYLDITIPYGITRIEKFALPSWFRLRTLNIPDTVTEIGEGSFAGCENLQKINLPRNLVSIEDRLLQSCHSLTEIKLPNSLKKIGGRSFQHCDHITELIIPNSVEIIKDYAFDNCKGLRKVLIPESLREYGIGMFNGCFYLREIYLPSKCSEKIKYEMHRQYGNKIIEI